MNSRYPDMQEPFELKGFWWLPHQPEEQISGIVRFDPDQGITLESIEGFEIEAAFHDETQIDVILGMSTNGEQVSLHKCSIIQSTIFPRIQCTHLKARYLIFGQHFSQLTDLNFTSITIRYHNLEIWAKGLYGFNTENNSTEQGTTVKFSSPRQLRAKIGEEFELRFGADAASEHQLLPNEEVIFRSHCFFQLEANRETSWEKFQKIIARINDFLSLGIGEPTFPIEIIGISEATKRQLDDQTYHKPVSIYYAAIRPQRIRPVHSVDMRFPLKLIQEEFETIIQKWFERADLLPIYVLYFGNLYAPGAYLHQRFLSLVQAVEAYHRRVKGTTELSPEEHEKRYEEILTAIPEKHRDWFKQKVHREHSNEVNLRKRLNLLMEEHSEVLTEYIKKRKFVDEVANTRNYFTHYGKESESRAVTQLESLHCLCEKLKTLIEVCILFELGFSHNQIRQMMREIINQRKEVDSRLTQSSK